MCGKKRGPASGTSTVMGSPPHVREEVLVVDGCNIDERITPACAGRRLAGFKVVEISRDHPRMCGKKAA